MAPTPSSQAFRPLLATRVLKPCSAEVGAQASPPLYHTTAGQATAGSIDAEVALLAYSYSLATCKGICTQELAFAKHTAGIPAGIHGSANKTVGQAQGPVLSLTCDTWQDPGVPTRAELRPWPESACIIRRYMRVYSLSSNIGRSIGVQPLCLAPLKLLAPVDVLLLIVFTALPGCRYAAWQAAQHLKPNRCGRWWSAQAKQNLAALLQTCLLLLISSFERKFVATGLRHFTCKAALE